ncbi:hypothetical protein GKZ89_10010 [Bacillus mangrovi]|uniref:Uncharacterized protein n=1 Tax=Metabacillus mangrovi TaxID=1491830 RepID=A0A7X2S5P6_9BACI|nr:STM3941 family protein [Metabacillus mangrovi]MTH53738.1 hypothetical protein [Metabacillus mangrovi]
MNRLEIYENKTKLWMLMGLIALVGIGFLIPIVLYLTGSNEISLFFFLLSIAIEGLLIWVASKWAARIRTKSPCLIVEEDSITIFPNPGNGINLLKTEIDGAIPYSINGQKFIGLALRNEEEKLEELPPAVKRTVSLNKKTGFPIFNVHLNYISNKDLQAVLQQFEAIGLPLGTEPKNQRDNEVRM